jgi:hypothetical protein
MEFVYILIGLGSEWEDNIVFLNESDAINASIHHPKSRVEIFNKSCNRKGYIPTYNFYKNGILYNNAEKLYNKEDKS